MAQPSTTTKAKLLSLLGGNESALNVVLELSAISHTWDDLIDKDRPVEDRAIHQAFTSALVGLNLNPFFRDNATLITPVMLTGILNWHASNTMQATGQREQLAVAHVIRHAAGDVALLAAAVINGIDQASRDAAEIRMLMQTGDTVDQFIAEHSAPAGAGE